MKKFLRPRTVLAAVLFALLAFLLGAVLWNRGHARYEALPEADRFMLDEWNTYHQGTADQDLWEGFQLQERSILALNGSSGVGYLIQPAQPVRNPLAAKLAGRVCRRGLPDLSPRAPAALPPRRGKLQHHRKDLHLLRQRSVLCPI